MVAKDAKGAKEEIGGSLATALRRKGFRRKN
jgi:hypothetical protein